MQFVSLATGKSETHSLGLALLKNSSVVESSELGYVQIEVVAAWLDHLKFQSEEVGKKKLKGANLQLVWDPSFPRPFRIICCCTGSVVSCRCIVWCV